MEENEEIEQDAENTEQIKPNEANQKIAAEQANSENEQAEAKRLAAEDLAAFQNAGNEEIVENEGDEVEETAEFQADEVINPFAASENQELFGDIEQPKPLNSSRNMERLLDVEMDVTVQFGKTEIPLRDAVSFGIGSMIELNRSVDEPVELLVNNYPFARGEVVVIDGYYGVKITEIGSPEERSQTLLKNSIN